MEQAKDEHTREILKELKDIKCRAVIAECNSVVNGLLYLLLKDDDLHPRLVLLVPRALQSQIMKVGHDSEVNCHLGFAKTLARIRKTFYWSMMVEDIRQYCKMCDSCQKMKPLHRKRGGLLQPIVPDRVQASQWGADFIGPMPKGTGGVQYVLIAVDYTTRFMVIQAARMADGKAMQKFLKESVIQRYGWMKWLKTDQGTPFRS